MSGGWHRLISRSGAHLGGVDLRLKWSEQAAEQLLMRTLWRKCFECEELTGDGKGGAHTLRIRKHVKGVNLGRVDPGWSKQGAEEQNKEDIVDNINILL